MILSDSYFSIGKQHANEGKPCQDYSFAQSNGEFSTAIISDGCSTGGETDLGSRLMVWSALSSIVEHGGVYSYSIKKKLEASANLIGLSNCDLLATLGVIHSKDNVVKSYLFGDGVIAKKNDFGDLIAIKYEWTTGFPYYLQYDFDDYVAQACRGSRFALVCRREQWKFNYSESQWCHKFDIELSALSGIAGFEMAHPDLLTADQDSDSFIAIFSDGISQIKDVDWKDAVFEFMNYRSTSGEFVKRRMIKALRTMTPIDDITCAALRIVPDEINESDSANA